VPYRSRREEEVTWKGKLPCFDQPFDVAEREKETSTSRGRGERVVEMCTRPVVKMALHKGGGRNQKRKKKEKRGKERFQN